MPAVHEAHRGRSSFVSPERLFAAHTASGATKVAAEVPPEEKQGDLSNQLLATLSRSSYLLLI